MPPAVPCNLRRLSQPSQSSPRWSRHVVSEDRPISRLQSFPQVSPSGRMKNELPTLCSGAPGYFVDEDEELNPFRYDWTQAEDLEASVAAANGCFRFASPLRCSSKNASQVEDPEASVAAANGCLRFARPSRCSPKDAPQAHSGKDAGRVLDADYGDLVAMLKEEVRTAASESCQCERIYSSVAAVAQLQDARHNMLVDMLKAITSELASIRAAFCTENLAAQRRGAADTEASIERCMPTTPPAKSRVTWETGGRHGSRKQPADLEASAAPTLKPTKDPTPSDAETLRGVSSQDVETVLGTSTAEVLVDAEAKQSLQESSLLAEVEPSTLSSSPADVNSHNVYREQQCNLECPCCSAQEASHPTHSQGKSTEDAVAVSSRTRSKENGVERGDIVVLGCGAPSEYCGSHAVVQQVSESHCTVAVLDESVRFGIGECWPNFTSVKVESEMLRLGSRVVIDGFQGQNTRRINGRTGTIVEHPREGHPSFIKKPTAPDQPILTVCVHFDEPTFAGPSTMMIEPRFMVPYHKFVQRAVAGLRDCKSLHAETHDAPVASLL